MSRRVPVQTLRGSDPKLLEIQLQDFLRRPLAQLAPINALDLIELAGTEGRPKSLEKQLSGFAERIAREIGDLPSGASFDAFLVELSSIDGTRVPHRFRAILEVEAERDDRPADDIRRVLESWTSQEPTPFALGVQRAAVQQIDAVEPPPEAPKKEARPRGTTSTPRERAPVDEGRQVTLPSGRPGDADRQRLLENLCFERLSNSSSTGLGEAVLVAGVRHAAKTTYENVTPNEVTLALKALKARGKARYSAGRWSAPGV